MLIMFISGMEWQRKCDLCLMYHSNYQLLVFDDSAKNRGGFRKWK